MQKWSQMGKESKCACCMHRQIILVVRSMLQHWPRHWDPTRGRNWINWFSSTSYYAGSPRTSSRTGFYNVYIQSDDRGNRKTSGGGRGLCKLRLNIRVNKWINKICKQYTICTHITYYLSNTVCKQIFYDDQGRIQFFFLLKLKNTVFQNPTISPIFSLNITFILWGGWGNTIP